MPLIAQSFGSGSSGNGLFIKSGATALLIDCGLGPRVLAGCLRPHGVAAKDLTAILITHEHDDHVRGLATIKKLGVPIRCSAGTAGALRLDESAHQGFLAGSTFVLGGADVTAISVSHDAADPVGYFISLDGFAVCVVTDLGEPNERLAGFVAAADLIVFEANHDEHMLRSGPYPAHLKKRVASSSGHLSNARAGDFLRDALARQRRPRTIWLAHLSETNNRPALAVETVSSAFGPDAGLHEVIALPRRTPGPIWRSVEAPRQLELSAFEQAAIASAVE